MNKYFTNHIKDNKYSYIKDLNLSEDDLQVKKNDIENIEYDENDDEFNNEYDDFENGLKIYLKEISNYKVMTSEEEIELAKKIENNDKLAEEEFINRSLRLVPKIAKRYINRGLDLQDLIQEGNIGLSKAVKKYDYRKGYRFSTYATYWIMQSISRAVYYKGRTIKLPLQISEKIVVMNRYMNNYYARFGKEPEREEIAKELDISLEEVPVLLSCRERIESLNTEIEYGTENVSEKELLNSIPDENINIEDEIISKIDIIERFKEVFKTLDIPQRNLEMLLMRVGDSQTDSQSYEEIGKKFGMTSERTRQIIKRTLTILNLPNNKTYVENYIKGFQETEEKDSGGFAENGNEELKQLIDKVKEECKLSDVEMNVYIMKLGLEYGKPNSFDNIAKQLNITKEIAKKTYNKVSFIIKENPVAYTIITGYISKLRDEKKKVIKNKNLNIIEEIFNNPNLNKLKDYSNMTKKELEIVSLRYGLINYKYIEINKIADLYETLPQNIIYILNKATKKIYDNQQALKLFNDMVLNDESLQKNGNISNQKTLVNKRLGCTKEELESVLECLSPLELMLYLRVIKNDPTIINEEKKAFENIILVKLKEALVTQRYKKDKAKIIESIKKENISVSVIQTMITYINDSSFSSLLNKFDYKELISFILYYGLYDNNRYSIEDISNFFGLKIEEVDNIIKNILKSLRENKLTHQENKNKRIIKK